MNQQFGRIQGRKMPYGRVTQNAVNLLIRDILIDILLVAPWIEILLIHLSPTIRPEKFQLGQAPAVQRTRLCGQEYKSK